MTPQERLRGPIIAAGMLLGAVITLAAGWDAWRLHQQLLAANEGEVVNLANALATGTARSVQAVDILLRDTAAWYEATGRLAPDAVILDALAARAVGVPQVRVMTIVDSSGLQRYRSRTTGAPLGNVSDRGYFRRQRDEPDAGLVINEPVLTRSEQIPALVLSRALRRQDGSFDGVVSAIVTLQELQGTYAAIRIGKHSSVLLALADGTIVTRLPGPARQLGARMPELPALAAGPPVAHVVSPVDGRKKLVAVMRVEGRPLILAVTRDRREALAPWNDEMTSAGVRVCISLLLVLFTIVAVLRQLQRIEAGEQVLRESQERYAMVMEAADEGHSEWDLVRGTAFVSARWRGLHGLDDQRPVGTIQDFRRSVRLHAGDAKAVREALDQHLAGLKPGVDMEYRVLYSDGTWKWLHSRGRCVRDGASAPVRLFLAANDISARKEAETARAALELRMQQVRRMEALGTLAAGVAHDFNNLLGAILGFGGLARQLAGEGSPIGRHIDHVLHAGARARSLIERILQFSGARATATSTVNMQCLVKEVVVIHSATLPPGVSVETRLHAPDAEVAGDATSLYQLVANLYTNAVEAVGTSGQVRIVLGAQQVTASELLSHGELKVGPYVRVDVEDSGSGIAPANIGRIFEPFFTTKRHGEGAGLGLSVVHGIVSGLAGAIDVCSEPGAGTRLSVWLPVVEASAPAAAESGEGIRGHGEVILVIDDDPPLVELAVKRLTALGYAALAYTSSREALSAFLAAPASVDLVLTDEAMPELSGSEIVAALRARGHDVPVVLMSGNVTPALEDLVRSSGVCALLRKPCSGEAVAAALARCLRSQARPADRDGV